MDDTTNCRNNPQILPRRNAPETTNTSFRVSFEEIIQIINRTNYTNLKPNY